jgi:hypothetical protein
MEENEIFKKHYKEELTLKEQTNLRDNYMYEYAVTESTFYYRMNKSGFSPSQKKFICRQLNVSPDVLWPNQNIVLPELLTPKK